MKRPRIPALPLPQYDYGLALRKAVSWLGDRYLLAQPVARRPAEHTPFFADQPSWHDSRPAPGLRGRRH